MTSAPRPPDIDEREDDAQDEEMPRPTLSRRNLLLGLIFIVAVSAFLYYGLPQLADLDNTWNRLRGGDVWWLGGAFVFTLCSFGGYVALFQGVYVRHGSRIDLRASYQITMASLAATRVFAAGGAGGIALTAWALRRSGMSRRTVADSTVAFLVLTYVVYMGGLVVCGLGLRWDILSGPEPWALTVLPALLGLVTISVFLLMALVPTDFERRLRDWARDQGRPRLARIAQRLATVPAATSAGVRDAIRHLRSKDPALLGSLAFWGFNIAVLWACFHAFGSPPPWGVLMMGYFVGMLGNLLPLPGGVGGVDGGMIGAFAAFGVEFGLATVAVLSYRGFAFWLPTIPGAIAYFQLRKTVSRWRAQPDREDVKVPAGCYYTK
ncbi:MAG TPA: lysylphosphatidylglycerol synthase transmembrane domain-containing protein [Solirubrobacteraceae bacterium]|nr:lysylphosphatidylglycerol synthase transmembrane domain-containing protein [Solirubrobacteraceae bacterium]